MNTKLFKAVIFNTNLWNEIQSHIKGKKYKYWTDGDLAAKLGYFSLIKNKNHNNEKMSFSINAMDWAAKYGYLDIIIWLHHNLGLYHSLPYL